MTTTTASQDDLLTAQIEIEQERREFAESQLRNWDSSRTRQLVCYLLSLTWLSIGGQTVLPVGLFVAMMILVPDVPGWSLWRRFRFTDRRMLYLVGVAALVIRFTSAVVFQHAVSASGPGYSALLAGIAAVAGAVVVALHRFRRGR